MELASDTSAATGSHAWQQALEALYKELAALDSEQAVTQNLLTAAPGTEFTALIAAEGDRAMDYLVAARRSYARSKTAEGAGQREWLSRHDTAAKKYLALAAEALRRQAADDHNSAAKLESERFAVRRPPDQAERVLEQLKRDGLTEEYRKLMSRRGLTPEHITAYERRLQAMPAAALGICMVELYRDIADARRQLAASLDEFSRDRWASGALGDSFLVGNPREREALVQLVVRRVAMPPEWTISLTEVESEAADKPAKRLRELEKGKRYEVRLAGGGEIRLVSEVTPVGGVPESTTARWAIEGTIGEEIVGGVVQEVNVPGFLPDLQLPPVAKASLPAPSAAGAASSAQSATSALTLKLGAAILLLFAIALGAMLIARAKRRSIKS